ncbi:vacuolar sorting-associated protein VPS27 [Pseudohyphozyma bogoriensis]|nr:vacuolar sorting-associated protein VPS27 [Pseudohyphozyma bogoriensis]
MSFLWGTDPKKAEFDALLEKTTSELAPSSTPPDLLQTLHLADLIRSSAVPPAVASKALLARLTHLNPNVQLLALAVIDICIKNGGTPFLLQVGGKEFAVELEKLARGTAEGNRDVKEKVKAKLQDWAGAFEQMDAVRSSELVRSYSRLKDEGLPFPPKDPTATAAMVDSLSAPEWKDSSYCSRCRTDFTTFNRKHHCRNCGDVFDQQCSSNNLPLPHFGVTEPVRVCDGCYKKLKSGVPGGGVGRSNSFGGGASARPDLPERSSTISGTTAKGDKRKSRREREEEDLAAAIAASLADAGSPSSTSGPAYQLRDPPQPDKKPGYNPSYKSTTTSSKKEEDDDPELAAAIAASLRDVAPLPSAPGEESSPPQAATYASLYPSYTSSYPSTTSYATSNAYPSLQQPRIAPLPSYDLSAQESSSIHAFANSLDPSHPPPAIGTRERELYEQARNAAPRLERGIMDTERRKEILVEMNGKLMEANRLYEGLLEERIRGSQKAYQSSPSPYAPQQASYYPQQQYSQPSYAQPYSTAQSWAPPPVPVAAPAPPQMGQPLPSSVIQGYQQQQQAYAPPPVPQAQQPTQEYAQPQAPTQPQPEALQQQSPQQQPQQQPAGYYKPSSFPSVPTGPQAMLLPHVPTETPWEREEERKVEEAKVGELIEF